jgi:transcriptional regulator with XRE-family HTH domain
MTGDAVLASFGERVRAARDLAGLRQQDLADATGLVRSSIANIEAGRQELSLTAAVRIAAVLNTTVGTLLGEGAEPFPWRELVTRVTASERTYQKLADDSWRAFDMTSAVRYRGMAEGLDMARNHHAEVIAEQRAKAVPACPA